MIEYGDKIYIIDLEAIDKVITIVPANSKTNEEVTIKRYYNGEGSLTHSEEITVKSLVDKTVDSIKYDSISNFIDIVTTDQGDDEDDALGAENLLRKKTLSFKIAFNSLLKLGIIKEI